MAPRLPRFERNAQQIAAFVVTARDREILRQVARHRHLSSRHLVTLLGGSPQPVLRRLRLLFHHGHLDRPKVQLDYFHRTGSRPLVYGLTRKGARVLDQAEETRVRPDHRNLKRLHLEHTLLVADVMVALEAACRGRANVRLIAEDELPKDQPGPFHWTVTVRHGGTSRRVGVVPDRVFALEEEGERIHYFLEADRGTMPVKRRSLTQSSVSRKLLAYEATWTQGIHRTQFGFHRFRVLVVTQSPERAEHLRAAAQDLARGHGLFLFTHRAALLAGDPLKLGWQTSRGEETERLL